MFVASTIAQWNELRPNDAMPVIIAVCEEVGDCDNEHLAHLEQLARQGRSAGIQLIITTQHPNADILSSQIQGNLSKRIVLRVPPKQVAVALGIRGGVEWYDPSAISRRFTAVLRAANGYEIVGVTPLWEHAHVQTWREQIAERYARAAAGTPNEATPSAEASASDGAVARFALVVPEGPAVAIHILRTLARIHTGTAWRYGAGEIGRLCNLPAAIVGHARNPEHMVQARHDEVVRWLAVLRNDQGGWYFSMNQIVAFTGGTRTVVLEAIRQARGATRATADE